jgi:hypothetical protein
MSGNHLPKVVKYNYIINHMTTPDHPTNNLTMAFINIFLKRYRTIFMSYSICIWCTYTSMMYQFIDSDETCNLMSGDNCIFITILF